MVKAELHHIARKVAEEQIQIAKNARALIPPISAPIQHRYTGFNKG